MAITKIINVQWGSIDKISGITKSSITNISGIQTIQSASLSATKYGRYTLTSTVSWTALVNALSSSANETQSLSLNSAVFPGRTTTNYTLNRTNLQFDLSSYSTSSILSATLKIDVTSVVTTATPNEVYVLDLGGATFNFPTLNNADYSLVYQQGTLTEYAHSTIDTAGIADLEFSAAAITEANTYPSAYSMALLTYHDRNDIAPALNEQYLVGIQTTSPYQPPELLINFV